MKQITLIFEAPPYGGQETDTVFGIARAALEKGRRVTVVGSGDGTYGFLKDQRASEAPSAGQAMLDGSYEPLVDLMESCDRVVGIL